MLAALLARWQSLTAQHRIAALCAAVAVTLGLCAVGFATRDTRVALFAAPLRPEQTAEVVERLAEWNAAFVVTGDNVRVDADRRNALLLRLALAGIPRSHLDSSSDALAHAGPLTPQSVLDAQQLEGLDGDLAAGIRSLSGVADAQVIVAPARDATYADEGARRATASVRLSLQPGAIASQTLLAGVRAFVASAVADLDPKSVAIVDDRGLALGGDASLAPDDARSLESSLQGVLDGAYGDGSTIVRVRVSYDSRERETHDVMHRAAGDRPIDAVTRAQRYKSSGKQYTTSEETLERGTLTSDERIQTPAGRVERISVAVAVDADKHADLAKIRSLAAATLGLVPSRGDTLSVQTMPFAHASAAPARTWAAVALGFAAAVLPSLALALGLIVIARSGVKPFARVCETALSALALGRVARDGPRFPPAAVRGVLRDEPPHTAAAIISALPAATATAVLELYPPEERAAIVHRMARATAPIVPDYEMLARRG